MVRRREVLGRIAFRVLGVAIVGGATIGWGQEDATPTPKGDAGASKGLEELNRAAESYKVETETRPSRPASLLPESILHWTNPLRKTHDGAVFLWVAQGRPQVAASFYRYK